MSNQVFGDDVFGLNAQNDLRMAKKDMLWQTFVADFLPKQVARIMVQLPQSLDITEALENSLKYQQDALFLRQRLIALLSELIFLRSVLMI